MEPVIMHAERRVTIADAGRQLGVDRRAVKRMIDSGDLRVIVPPGGVKNIVLQSSLDELLARMYGSNRSASV